MSSTSIAVVGVLLLIGAVAAVEFAAAPAGRRMRPAVVSATLTAAILGALLVLAAGFEWWQQS